MTPSAPEVPEPGAAARKAALRERLLAARAGMPDAVRAEASRRIAERLLELEEVRAARTVLGYAAVRGEADVTEFLRGLLADGVTVLLPRVSGEGLVLGRVRDLDTDLVPGWRGVPEPRDQAAVEVGLVDVAVVPGVGFDRHGRRLGYGGGHFDRFLATLPRRARVIGAAFSAQVLPALPEEAHDARVDAVVTEHGTVAELPIRDDDA